MNRYGKRCVLYPRVSTEMQVDGYSLEGQKNMLTRFADREEMIIVDTYEDAGKSGKSIEGRPAFQKMLRDIEDGLDIDYILVYKLSRFGRNAADILNSLELVQSYGVNLICIEEGIDSSQTSGKLLISVLSAVAEIERENIIEQTMNGRREKARQGGWNGGFAPYGYTLEDNKLMIEETEAVAIRKIFELYTSSEIGLGGIANQLNLQGIRKIPRQNGTLEDWTGHFIKLILDNPVYCGKIAYGRRTKEKVKGTKNDYQMKRNDDYILTEGQHKGIVSEEVWEKAHAKRLRTGVKQPSKIGRDRVHLLSGLLKCPVCGSPMYTNKHAWTNKDGTYKEIYYYVCSRNRMVRGKHCEYKAMLKKTDIEPMVIEAIREIVRNEEYAQAIKKRIGVQIDTKAVDKELEGYQAKLKEVDLNKTRLEREIDSLPADAKYRERKLHDMTLRLDSLYDVIVELEEKIEDARLRRDAIKQQAITLENIYKIMVNFDCVYNIINDEEKRNVVTALIKEIEIYRNDESEYPLKRIGLNFPVFKDGGEVTELLWDKGNTVEAVVLVQLFQQLGQVGGLLFLGHFAQLDVLLLDEQLEQTALGQHLGVGLDFFVVGLLFFGLADVLFEVFGGLLIQVFGQFLAHLSGNIRGQLLHRKSLFLFALRGLLFFFHLCSSSFLSQEDTAASTQKAPLLRRRPRAALPICTRKAAPLLYGSRTADTPLFSVQKRRTQHLSRSFRPHHSIVFDYDPGPLSCVHLHKFVLLSFLAYRFIISPLKCPVNPVRRPFPEY